MHSNVLERLSKFVTVLRIRIRSDPETFALAEPDPNLEWNVLFSQEQFKISQVKNQKLR
jgi:hypothetical protein